MIAALYVETGGCYFGLSHVDPWDRTRDARAYAGPWLRCGGASAVRAVGRFLHRDPHASRTGTTWATMMDASRRQSKLCAGGVEYSNIRQTAMPLPLWVVAAATASGRLASRTRRMGVLRGLKATTDISPASKHGLYVSGKQPPELIWGPCEQRLHPVALARHGYAKASPHGRHGGGHDRGQAGRRKSATPRRRHSAICSSGSPMGTGMQTMPHRPTPRRCLPCLPPHLRPPSSAPAVAVAIHPARRARRACVWWSHFPAGGWRTRTEERFSRRRVRSQGFQIFCWSPMAACMASSSRPSAADYLRPR